MRENLDSLTQHIFTEHLIYAAFLCSGYNGELGGLYHWSHESQILMERDTQMHTHKMQMLDSLKAGVGKLWPSGCSYK